MKSTEGSRTKIINCSCANAYQDRRYGKGRRVANRITKTGNWRCTVCAREAS